MKKRLPLVIIEGTALVLILIAILISFLAGKYETTRITANEHYITSSYDIDGTIYTGNELPVTKAFKKNVPITITTRIPNDISDGYSICFLALYCRCEVSVAGNPIGSYGEVMPLSFGHMLGNIRVIVPVDPSMSGSLLTIELTPFYSISNADISQIMIGPTGDIKFLIHQRNTARVIIITILLTLALTSFVLLLNQILEKSDINIKLYGNFILTVLFVATWIFFSSDLPQFITNANEAASLVSFLSLSCIPIAYAGFCEQMFERRQRLFYFLQLAGWVIPIMNVLMFLFNIADPMNILIFTHIYTAIVVISSVICAFLEPQKTLETKFFLVGIFILLIAVTGGFICYYLAPSRGDDAVWFGIGFIGFIGSLFLLILARQVSLIKERQNLNAYKHLAYNNVITGLSNRAAFDEQFANMKNSLSEGEPVTLFLIDLYNYRTLSETLGHQAADNALRLTGQNLKKVFRDHGTCYHFGGSEFGVVIERTMVDVRKLKSSFEDITNRTVFMSGTKLSVLASYATLPFTPDNDIKDKLFDNATEAMREEENRMKAINSPILN